MDSPNFVGPAEAGQWLDDREPVISFELNGDAKAYPLQILTWHEIVNDQVGGTPVAVTFCPLCNSAIVFDRRLEGVVLDFGTSGRLRHSDLIMWDRQTQSWWQQLTGDAIVGQLTGRATGFPACRNSNLGPPSKKPIPKAASCRGTRDPCAATARTPTAATTM